METRKREVENGFVFGEKRLATLQASDLPARFSAVFQETADD